MKLSPAKSIRGSVAVPGDKSISHRAVMFGSLAKGTTEIHGFLQGADCLSTISCFEKMGVSIENKGDVVLVHGNGLHGLKKPETILDCGNSGTTTRLISGILSAQDFDVTLTGDASIQKRPMLLAGLYADGITQVTEPFVSRNHSERMLKLFGASVSTEGTTASISPATQLYGQKVMVPGDISSAAYFIAAGLMVPGSEILIKNVGINPTRDGLLHVCRAMGADLTLLNVRGQEGEPTADILVRHSALHGTTVGGAIIPTLIDELPMIAAMAAAAEGETRICDAGELKVKESNRIAVMVENLTAMGADVTETEDGMIIRGGKPLHGAVINSHLDHRIAMTFAVTAQCAEGLTTIQGADCVNISYPRFYEELMGLIQKRGVC